MLRPASPTIGQDLSKVTNEKYKNAIKASLKASLLLRNIPSTEMPHVMLPEVEVRDKYGCQDLVIANNEYEKTLIQASINSVRISVKVRQMDKTDTFLVGLFMKFLCQRAESLKVIRRKPIENYDLSFLITFEHSMEFERDKLIDSIVEFIGNINSMLHEMKLNLNARARHISEEFLRTLI